MDKSSETDYLYGLLFEGKMDLMFLPAGAVAWLWQYDRPDAQMTTASNVAAIATRAGNPVVDADLLRADQNILSLHLQSGAQINVYPDGGMGSEHNTVTPELLGTLIQGVGDPVAPEPTVELPDDLNLDNPMSTMPMGGEKGRDRNPDEFMPVSDVI